MTPAQRKRKAAKALDLYKKAYNEAMELLREDRDNDRAEKQIGYLLATHELFMEMRRIAEAEQDAERGGG